MAHPVTLLVMRFVTYYVIKLQMQKQIPTLLQAFEKQLYEVRLNISINRLMALMLDSERSFKTV
jgi:hypothetical protein